MKLGLFFMLVIYSTITFAQVFKCENTAGSIVYQDSECIASDIQKEILIQVFDDEKIVKAQEKLKNKLKIYKERQLAQQQLNLKKQEMQAIYEQAERNKELSEELRKNLDEIQSPRESQFYSRPWNQYYYLNPYYQEKRQFKGRKHNRISKNNKLNGSSAINPPKRRDNFNPPLR